jgi:hypothetical protein
MASVALAGAVLAPPPPAAAQPAPAQPAAIECQALANWLRGYDMRDFWQPNGMASGMLHAIFFRDDVAQVFGRPALEWAPAEARALAARAEQCAEEIMRERVRGWLGPMQQLSIHAQELAQYLALLAEARARVASSLHGLAEAEPTVPLLAFLQVLAGLGDDYRAHAELERAAQQLADPARAHAVDIVRAVPLLPRPEIAQTSRRVGEDVTRQMARFTDASRRRIAEGPATREEVVRLGELARAVEAAAPAILPQALATEIADRVAARQAEIRRVLTDRAIAAVNALPASWQAVSDLGRFRPEEWERPGWFVTPQAWQADLPALDAEQRRHVAAAVAARRDAMVEELLAGTLAGIARARFLGELNTAIGVFPPPGAPPEAAQRIERAALERAQAIGDASLREFRRELGRMPVEQQTLDELDGLLRDLEGNQPKPWLAAWTPRIVELIRNRRAEVVTALNRLEAGSFAGRIYEGQGVRVEFLNARRAVVSRFGSSSLVAVEEIGDGRVVLMLDGRQVVATREGRRLVGLGPALLRVR